MPVSYAFGKSPVTALSGTFPRVTTHNGLINSISRKELVNFNPHFYIIASNGCFSNNSTFIEGISPNADDLLVPFAKAVFKMLKKEKVISLAVINNIATWQHSGFNILCGLLSVFQMPTL